MRVLHVHSEFMPQSSGVARHMNGLISALAQNPDIDSRILVQHKDTPEPPPCPCSDQGFSAVLAQVRACDVLHAHGSRTALSAVALRLARWLGKPTVFTPHCYYQGGSPWRRMAKKVWDFAIEQGTVRTTDAMILLHDGWIEQVQSIGLSPKHVEIIPNCLDIDSLLHRLRAAPQRRLSGAPALLSIGRLDPIKRIDDVIRSLAHPALHHAELHVVGRGPDAERLHALAATLAVRDRVHFLGWQSDEDSAALMRGCDMMVLASEREGLPTVLLEALGTGIPILASDIEGNRAITDLVGWPHLFPMGNCEALAQGVLACHAASGVSPLVQQSIRNIFSWQSRAADVAALYAALLEQKVRPS